MLSAKSLPCFDAGSDYCPCVLADLGQCVACSLLRGESTCDCGWSGICIYEEFLRAGQVPKPARSHHKVETIRFESLSKLKTDYSAFLVEIAVPLNMALWCTFPGTFVLLRPEASRDAFNVPLSVMKTSPRSITVAVECHGPKTTALKQALLANKNLILSGPFWSGLQGYDLMSKPVDGSTLIVAKGIAQAAVPLIAKYILARDGTVKALIGPGTLGVVFIGEALDSLQVPYRILPRVKDHNLGKLKQEILSNIYGFLISAGSKSQHQALLKLLKDISRDNDSAPRFMWVSHLTMACAEGICGSCLLGGFRGCKARFNNHFEGSLLS